MIENRIEFKLKNRLSELDKLCQNLGQLGDSLEFSRKTIVSINLALDELITNIISYGYTDNLDHFVVGVEPAADC